MKTTTNSIILNNRESREAGHHEGHTPDGRDADRIGGEIRQAAHGLAKRNGCHVEVFATRRGCQPWVVYACEAE